MSVVVAAALSALAPMGADLCGNAELAQARLEEQIARFKPGMTFEQVRTNIGPPDALPDYWGSPPRKDMGPWILRGVDGDRVVVRMLLCDFNDSDALTACRPWDDDLHFQNISEQAYDAVAVGHSLSSVVERLCEPGARRAGSDGSVVLEYRVQHPDAKHHTTCPAYLTFRDGTLTEKEQVCK